jgi:O-antigen ligase
VLESTTRQEVDDSHIDPSTLLKTALACLAAPLVLWLVWAWLGETATLVVGLLMVGGAAVLGYPYLRRWDLSDWAVALLIGSALIPFSALPSTSWGLSADDAPAIVGGVLMLVWLFRNRPTIRVPAVVWPLLLLVVWSSISWLAHDSSFGSLLRGPGRWAFYAFLLAWTLLAIRSPGKAHRWALILIGVGMMEAVFGLWAYLAEWVVEDAFIGIERFRNYQPLFRVVPGRIVGTLGLASNFFGAYLLIPAMIALGFGAGTPQRRAQISWSVVFVILFWAMALSYTRASLIGILLAMAGYLVVSRRLRMVPAIAVAVISVLLLTPLLSRFTEGNDRLALAGQAVDIVRDNPITGVGPGDYLDDQDFSDPGDDAPLVTPHNSTLLVAGELGIPGGLLFVVAVIAGFVAALGPGTAIRRQPRGVLAIAVAAGLGAFVVQSMSNNVFQIPVLATQFWVAVAIGGSLAAAAGSGVSKALVGRIEQ